LIDGERLFVAMFDYRYRLMIVLAACLFGSATGQTAEIRVDPSRGQGAGAVFEGRIEVGDFDRLKKFLLEGPGATEIISLLRAVIWPRL
jgi:hypothetical protein